MTCPKEDLCDSEEAKMCQHGVSWRFHGLAVCFESRTASKTTAGILLSLACGLILSACGCLWRLCLRPRCVVCWGKETTEELERAAANLTDNTCVGEELDNLLAATPP